MVQSCDPTCPSRRSGRCSSGASGVRSFVLVTVVVSALLSGLVAVAGPVAASPGTTVWTFGSEPVDDVVAAAAAAVAKQPAGCGLETNRLAAMMIAPTFEETGAVPSAAPSPMTLSRWDSGYANLYAFGDSSATAAYRGAFFSPGIGMWQFDSAGGWNLTAATAINTSTSAPVAAGVMASRYCASSSTDKVAKMRYAWSPWSVCATTDQCVGYFNDMFDGTNLSINRLGSVTRLGGMVPRTCAVEGIGTLSCYWVNPALAQGDLAWTKSGSTPLPKPFYDFQANGREYRYWLAGDTGYAGTVVASKPVTANARSAVVWSLAAAGSQLCDTTVNVGSCANGWTGWTTLASSGVQSDLAVATNADGRLETFFAGANGQVVHAWQASPNGGWVGPVALGASPVLSPVSAARNGVGAVEVFGLDGSGAIWVNRQGTNDWVGWARLSTGVAKFFGVTANSDGRLELFGLDPAGGLVHQWQNWPGGTWSAWVPLGGPNIATASAAINSDGRMEAFGITTSGGLVHRWQSPASPSGWSDWAGLPGSFIGQPSVAMNTNGFLNVVVRGTGSTVSYLAQSSAAPSGWFGPTSLGSLAAIADPTSARNRDGRLETFMPLADGVIGHTWQVSPGASWGGLASLYGPPARSAVARAQADGRIVVLARLANGVAFTLQGN